jgi:hypothetical protein
MYGRQWMHPKSAEAFDPVLLKADNYAMTGDAINAIKLYKSLSNKSSIAKKRLGVASRQIKQGLKIKNNKANKINAINLGFVDWYEGFDQEHNFVLELFELAKAVPITTTPENADIIIAGCYGNDLMQQVELRRDKLVLFVSGENLRPSYDIHDYSLTTEWRNYCNKNIRYPQWFSDLDFGTNSISISSKIDKPFDITPKRNYLISAIYNNSTPLREELVNQLRKEFGINNIHLFGSQRSGHVNKLEILSKSVINLCLENSIGEGYVTEKLHHSIIMGCKSIYWGDKFYEKDFNNKDVINLYENPNIEECLSWCKKQIDSPSPPATSWNIHKESNYSKQPNRQDVINHIANIISIILTWRRLGR